MEKYLVFLALFVCQCYAEELICDSEYPCSSGSTTGGTLTGITEDECLQVPQTFFTEYKYATTFTMEKIMTVLLTLVSFIDQVML